MDNQNFLQRIQNLDTTILTDENGEKTMFFNGTKYRFENTDAFLNWKCAIINDYMNSYQR